MDGFLGRYATYFYAIFRIVFGLMFMIHGTQKLFGFPPSKQPIALAGMLLGSAVIELLAGIMIVLGFFSAIAAFIACGEMAVAYFTVHQPNGGFPINNGGELAVLYCFAFLYIASRGSGVWSIDSILRGSRAGTN